MDLVDYLYCRKLVEEYDPAALRKSGERIPPTEADDFARRVAFVILNGGMNSVVAKSIWARMEMSLVETGAVGDSFRHPRKAAAIDAVMARRVELFADFSESWEKGRDDVIDFCGTLPYVGPTTKFHVAKLLGVDCAKPDVWLERVAEASQEGVQELCIRLASESGDRVATVDYVIWRACERGWWPVDNVKSNGKL